MIKRGQHQPLHRRQPLHLAFELGQLLLQMRRLRRQRLRRLLSIGRVELGEIPRDAIVQLCTSPLHFPAREVLVAGVHGLELASVDCHARLGEQAHLATQRDAVIEFESDATRSSAEPSSKGADSTSARQHEIQPDGPSPLLVQQLNCPENPDDGHGG